ncbi:MAG: formate dehydrogenase subunit alpha, partial [Candidatus Desulforudis sp.]|nr:formate dehydrogenase subunit alpha [Desulforudis sp.]
HTGTMTRRSETLEGEAPESFVEVNPADAERMGIANGEKVKVYSRRGELALKAVVTDRVPLNTLFIPFHFAEAAANVLTNPVVDPVAKIPEYKVCAAAVGKL